MGPDARNGLSLAYNGSRFHGVHSRVKVPGLQLRVPRQPVPLPVRPFCSTAPTGSPRSGLLLRFWPVAAFLAGFAGCFSSLHFSSGFLHPSGSKRSTGPATARPAFRIRPISSRSPQPSSISSYGYGSPLLVRYVSGGLLRRFDRRPRWMPHEAPAARHAAPRGFPRR